MKPGFVHFNLSQDKEDQLRGGLANGRFTAQHGPLEIGTEIHAQLAQSFLWREDDHDDELLFGKKPPSYQNYYYLSRD